MELLNNLIPTVQDLAKFPSGLCWKDKNKGYSLALSDNAANRSSLCEKVQVA
jgi:hypothetical protein